MGVVVRPMTDGDDLDALNADDPDAWIALWWADIDPDQRYIRWFTAELDGEAIGFGAALREPAARDGHGAAIVRVLPAARRRGAGTALLLAVEESVREAGLPGVLLSRKEGDPAGEGAAAAWGLREVGRHRDNELDLTRIDRAAFEAGAAGPGVDLVALPPLEDMRDERWTRLHEFFAARYVEAPDADGGAEAPPFPVFRGLVSDPWSIVTAEEDGRLVGLTIVSRRPGTADTVNTFFTGTAPEARGRGIATALKCRQALMMADAGIAKISTQNLDGNTPIIAANRTLGFVEAGGHVDVVRTF